MCHIWRRRRGGRFASAPLRPPSCYFQAGPAPAAGSAGKNSAGRLIWFHFWTWVESNCSSLQTPFSFWFKLGEHQVPLRLAPTNCSAPQFPSRSILSFHYAAGRWPGPLFWFHATLAERSAWSSSAGNNLSPSSSFKAACQTAFGSIKLGKCHFLHGSNHGKDVARKMAGMFGGNVVFAHVHTQQAVTVRTVTAGEIGAWCPGCLCALQPLYRHSSITDWSLGYAFQIVHSGSDDFLHINVPVIGDRSLLQGFAGVL